MHGLAGTFGIQDGGLANRMLAKLAHRGPGRGRVEVDDDLTIGARGGKGATHPLAEGGGTTVASDAYLFNRMQLAERYLDGEEGALLPDHEFLLELYTRLGTRMFQEIDGAYAVAIADNGKLVLARDRYGLKPLYISKNLREGAFSSEMKSQMLTGEDFAPFPPGTVFTTDKGCEVIRKRRFGATGPPASQSRPDLLRELLTESVGECIRSSPGVNVLLSGGLDSSAVTAAAARVTGRIESVCVGMEDSEDLRMARLVSETLGTNHTERTYGTEDMLAILDKVVYYAESYDYPIIRSCIPNFMATHLFRSRGLVTLCGEGGDEVFAGYDHMRGVKGDQAMRRERLHLLRTGHSTGFQRVDRMTASASLDGRMPIMGGRVVEFGLSLPRRDLIGRRAFENKLVLRKAFEGDLPKEVVWRAKRRFSDGAGSMHALAGIAEGLITDAEFAKERAALPKGAVRTKEELLYYRSFVKHFDMPCAREAVGFTPRP